MPFSSEFLKFQGKWKGILKIGFKKWRKMQNSPKNGGEFGTFEHLTNLLILYIVGTSHEKVITIL